MKRTLSLLLAIVMLLALAACGTTEEDAAEETEGEVEVISEPAEESELTDETEEETEPAEETEEETEPAEETEEETEPSDDTEEETESTEEMAEEVDPAELGTDSPSSYIPTEGTYAHEFDDDTITNIQNGAYSLFVGFDEDVFGEIEYASIASEYFNAITWCPTGTSYARMLKDALNGDETAISAWDSLRDLMLAFSDAMESWINIFYDGGDYHAAIVLYNDMNASNALMMSYDGEIIYDALTD